MKDLRDSATLIATPDYAFPGCEGGTHCSFLVARAGDPRLTLPDFRGATAAVNSSTSNSGMNLFRAAIAPLARRRALLRRRRHDRLACRKPQGGGGAPG